MKAVPISLLALFIFLFPNALKAQSDYVVTQKGDTINCYISSPLFTGMGSMKYKQAGESKSIKIKPEEIREYRKGKNNTFRSVRYATDGKPTFLEVFEDGKICLYGKTITSTYSTGVNSFGGVRTNTYWYINKAQRDTVSALKTDDWKMSKSRKDRKNEFGEMIKEDKTLYNKYITDDKFTFDQLRYLIHQYNLDQSDKK